MLNFQALANDITTAITSQLNAGNKTATGEASELQAVIAAVLRKMNIVSRDEFDAQTAVLLRTRQKLEQLEQQVTRLEAEQANTQR